MSLEDVVLADNPDPICPCVLVLDTSASMTGTPINALNAGLRVLQQDIISDSLAQRRVHLSIVTFGKDGVNIIQPFTTIQKFEAPVLSTGGNTPMGAAIETALKHVRELKQLIKSNGAQYYRPWVFLITDGAPTDNWQAVAEQVHQEEKKHALIFFAVGVDEADMGVLSRIAVRQPLKLKGLHFTELFLWLSASFQRVSASTPGERVTLLPPDGWADV